MLLSIYESNRIYCRMSVMPLLNINAVLLRNTHEKSETRVAFPLLYIPN